MANYQSLLKMGKQAIDDLQLPFKVKKEKKNLEMKILELEQQQATDEATINEQKSANPINWDKLIGAINSRDLTDRKLKQLKQLEIEMFSEEA